MEERRDRRQHDTQIALLDMKQDHMEATLSRFGEQIDRVEHRVMKIEKSVYMFIGAMLLIQFLPMLSKFVGTVS